MFFDPFAALGIYDPVIRDNNGKVVKRVNFPLVVIWLIAGAFYFTIKLRFINFRGFIHAIGLLQGKYADPDSPGDLTHFQALSTALSGTVGLGNIAGVALAISMGGPGATFWMVLAGLLGMSLKFAECTLGLKYREIDEDGEIAGGPMYYLEKAFAKREWVRFGKTLGFTWAFLAMLGSLGGGNMFQANQSFSICSQQFPWLKNQGVLFGSVLAFLVALVIFGGVKSIGRVTGTLVPFMAILYVSTGLIIILVNIHRVFDVFQLILAGAFKPSAIKGGFIGVMVIGLRRAAFSNEAGVGTAAIAHSAAKTREPVAEGVVALHEPFVDTVVICTMTAMVLIFSGFHEPTATISGAALTSAAFGSVFPWFPAILTIAIMLFSFSTLVSFAYYGQKCFDFCFGTVFKKYFGRRIYGIYIYRLVFLLATVVGSASSVKTVMDYSDVILFGMAFTNTIGLFLLADEIKNEHDSYFARLANGEIRPN